MIFLIFYTFISLFRFQKNSKNKALSAILNEHNDSIVLFYAGDNSMYEQYFSVLNRAYHKYHDKVTIAYYDARKNPSEISSIPVNQNPEIAIFKKGNYAGSYYGDWTDTSIINFITHFVQNNWTSKQLNSQTSIFEFQEKSPTNLIFYGDTYIKLANKFRSFFDNFPSIPIAYVPDKDLANMIGIDQNPIIQLNRPFDEISIIFETFNPNNLKKALVPLIFPIYKNQIPGNSIKSKWTLIAIVNKHNKTHRYYFSEIVKHCKTVFDTLINYQICDFFDCNELTQLSGVSNISNPVLFAIKQFELKNSSKPIQYKQSKLSPISVRKWLRKITTYENYESDKLAKKLKTSPIPSISKSDFSQIVKDNSTDSIFLVNIKESNKESSSNTNEFNQYLSILYKLKDLFRDTESIRFFEFSAELSKDEIVNLHLPHMSKTCIVLYPSTSEITHIAVPARDFLSCVEFLIYNIRSPLSSSTKEKIKSIIPNAVFNL